MTKKKLREMTRQLKKTGGLSEHERFLFARSLAATPDERWAMHENFLRSLNLFTHSSRKAYGFK
jgi:hypothetical protein